MAHNMQNIGKTLLRSKIFQVIPPAFPHNAVIWEGRPSPATGLGRSAPHQTDRRRRRVTRNGPVPPQPRGSGQRHIARYVIGRPSPRYNVG